MKNLIYTLAIIFSLATFTTAQNVDIVSLSYTKLAEQDVSEINFKILLPKQFKNKKTTIINGLEYHFVNSFFHRLPVEYQFDARLHEIQYTLGINQQFNDQWGIRIMARPTIASNFKHSLSTDDFFMQGSAIVHKAVGNDKIGLGTAYTNGFGEPKLIPLVMYKHKTSHWNIDVLAPVKLNAMYVTGNIMFGMKAEFEGNQYHMQLNEQVSEHIEKVDAIKFSRLNVGPTFGWKTNEGGRIEFSAGMAFNRIFKVVGLENNEKDFDLESGLFFKTGFYFGK